MNSLSRRRRKELHPQSNLGWQADPARPGKATPHTKEGAQHYLLTWLGCLESRPDLRRPSLIQEKGLDLQRETLRPTTTTFGNTAEFPEIGPPRRTSYVRSTFPTVRTAKTLQLALKDLTKRG
eukprot:2384072-Amphidinium_carterae.1